MHSWFFPGDKYLLLSRCDSDDSVFVVDAKLADMCLLIQFNVVLDN